jgi:nitroreductase/dihydropteridine reductase
LYFLIMDILSALNWRYATKAFDSTKKVSETDLQTLIESARLAPTSFGLPSVRLIHVTDADIRTQLRAASWGQSQITDASDLFVFAVPKTFTEADMDAHIAHLATLRNTPIEALAGYKQMVLGMPTIINGGDALVTWLQKQAYIALGFMMMAAAEMSIDACPVEGFDPNAYDEILGLSAMGLRATVVLPVGYRSADDDYQHRVKVRAEMGEFLISR